MIQLKSLLPLALAFVVVNTSAQTKPAANKSTSNSGSSVSSLNYE